MKTFLANARLIDPATGGDAPGGLLIDGDRIAALFGPDDPAPDGAAILDCAGRSLAPGIVDMRVFVGEPGERHKESYRSAGRAAAAGGVTTIVTQPATLPPLDDPEGVAFVVMRAAEACDVRVRPMAALTKQREGREMTEHAFLLDAGAVALTDCDRPVADPIVFRRCLTYAGGLGALVVAHPQDPHFRAAGVATEGLFASMRGLPGIPREAEAMALRRDLALVRMTGARYHADMLSTAEAIEELRRAKAEGLRVTAGASIHHLTLNEHDLEGWPTFFKLDPPLRAEEDRAATAEAVADGTIDVIVSSHIPQDEESKRQPFEVAADGAVGLETILPAALTLLHAGLLDLPTLFDRLSFAPSRLLGLETGRLAAGAPADLTLFDPDAPWLLDRWALESKSKNTPFDRRTMTGRALRTWVAGREVFAR